MKRIKDGVRVDLEADEWPETNGGGLKHGVAVLRNGKRQWRLSAEDIRRIQAADLLEDVPDPKTPGQRLHEETYALRGGCPWDAMSQVTRGFYEDAARRLGIKPEGE